MIDNNEIATIRMIMETLPTWPELGNLKTELRLALEFIKEKSLSPEDRRKITELVKDIQTLNALPNTKETIEKMRDKVIDILKVIFPEKAYEP